MVLELPNMQTKFFSQTMRPAYQTWTVSQTFVDTNGVGPMLQKVGSIDCGNSANHPRSLPCELKIIA
jgi:hypothetical protein